MNIYSTNKNYNGISATVQFRDGVGNTDNPYLIQWFIEHGYKTEEVQKPIEDMKVTELKELAKQKGIENFDKMKKDELIALLK